MLKYCEEWTWCVMCAATKRNVCCGKTHTRLGGTDPQYDNCVHFGSEARLSKANKIKRSLHNNSAGCSSGYARSHPHPPAEATVADGGSDAGL